VGGVNEKSAYNKELKNSIAQWGLAERIKFVGHCADMPAAMMLSDVVVSATSTEPEAFGRIAIEAQAMTKPIIATTHGGSLETVIDGKTGWLVPPINARALADALKQALGDPEERRRRGHSGRRWVMKHFTIKKMCRETLRVYEDLTRVHS
jgi:glycosyltransferase involved in cell wall biosynthesis